VEATQSSQNHGGTLLKVSITNTSYEKPSEGIQAAVLADVVDLGLQDTEFGKKDRARFVYVLEERDTDGRQKRAFQSFTKSFNAKAKLRKVLEQLAKAGSTAAQDILAKVNAGAKDVDIESVLGSQVSLLITVEDGKDGQPFAAITAIMKPASGQDVQPDDDFKRSKDRENS
jgi:hypothetical protein